MGIKIEVCIIKNQNGFHIVSFEKLFCKIHDLVGTPNYKRVTLELGSGCWVLDTRILLVVCSFTPAFWWSISCFFSVFLTSASSIFMRRLTLASRTAFKTDTHFYYSYFNSFLEAATVKHLSSVMWLGFLARKRSHF